MANSEDKTFHCELIDPAGKLLDCEALSVVVPAHDGQLGILRGHMPMLCQLGLGTMKVTPAAGTTGSATPTPGTAGPADLFFFIDGGCALVADYMVTVIAYDALALQDLETAQVEARIDEAARNAGSTTLPAEQRAHESERLRALQKLAESRRPA